MSATISIPNTQAIVNAEVVLDVAFQANGSSISSIQFDLGGISQADFLSTQAGGATVAANKLIQSNYLQDGKLRVLVFGLNQNVVADGVLAAIRFLARAAGVVELEFSNIVGSDASGQTVAVTGIKGTLTIIGGGNMPTEQELDAALATVSTGIATLATAVTELVAQVTALIAKIQTNPGIDLTDEIATATTLAASISTNTASLQAAIAEAKKVTAPPAA